MRKSPNQTNKSGYVREFCVAMNFGVAVFILAGSAFADDVPSSNMMKLSKVNMNAKLASEFQKYLQTGSPDAMCEFGMADHGTAFTAQSSPATIGVSKKLQLMQNQNLTWQVFNHSAFVTEHSNLGKH